MRCKYFGETLRLVVTAVAGTVHMYIHMYARRTHQGSSFKNAANKPLPWISADVNEDEAGAKKGELAADPVLPGRALAL